MIIDEEELKNEATLWENRLVKTCTLCKGTGSILMENGLMQMCSCMKKAKLNTYLVSWGFPRKYLGEDWSWAKCINESFIKECKDYSDNFLSNYYNGKGLFIYGPQGRGKSTVEVLIARDTVYKNNPDTGKRFIVSFILYDDLVKMTYSSGNPKLANKICNVPHLLILDNVGSETGLNTESKSSVSLLENILRKRDGHGYPTIISSNFTPEDIKIKYNDPVHDFIINNFQIVKVGGENLRSNPINSTPLKKAFKKIRKVNKEENE